MTTKNIQDVVAEIAEQYEEIVADDFSANKLPNNWSSRKDWMIERLTQLVKEVEAKERERIEKVSEFDARLAIEPSRYFLEGAVAMKKLILDNLTSDVTEQ